MKAHTSNSLGFLGSNIMSSVVVFIIAIPLSLGIALASGMPPVSALVAGIVGGVFVGLFSGAPLVVSGPAAGLSALVLSYMQVYGVQSVYKIVIFAGILQAGFGILKVGRLISLIPKALLEGVLSAIGLTILIGQLHILMGQKIPGGTLTNLSQLPASFEAAFQGSGSMYIVPAFACGLLALVIQLIWMRLPFGKKLPGALPATLLGTFVAMTWDMPRVDLAPLWPHVKSSLEQFSLSGDFFQFIVPAFGLALVASAESLLTARAIDVLVVKRQMRVFLDLERELLAQGLGNIISGVLGGMPITGVMVRSAANIDAGATSRMSTVFHGLLIAVFVLLLPGVLQQIPLAVLASILVITGWKLLNVKIFYHSMKNHLRQAYLWPLTTVAIISTDLLKGFGFGIAVWLISVAVKKKSPLEKVKETAA